MEPGIVCFQHCQSKIFSFSLPENCPICKTSLECAQFSIPPFRLPFPFIKGYQHPCSVIIKPTIGDFLNDYTNSKDLHIGVTTSKGTVVEYDQRGLQKSQNEDWNQCLLLDGADGPWMDHWDNTLNQICNQKIWTSKLYDEQKHNCFTFVLNFLRALNYGDLSQAAGDEIKFCEKLIIPRTTSAGKYISLYRKLRGRTFIESSV